MTPISDGELKHRGEVGRIDFLAALIMFPAILAHELTHVAVAWPWLQARRPPELFDRLVPPCLELDYPAGTPVLAVVVANLAPTLVGVVLAPFVVPWGIGLPFPLMGYVLGSWLLYTLPSGDDLAVLSVLF